MYGCITVMSNVKYLVKSNVSLSGLSDLESFEGLHLPMEILNQLKEKIFTNMYKHATIVHIYICIVPVTVL